MLAVLGEELVLGMIAEDTTVFLLEVVEPLFFVAGLADQQQEEACNH